MIKAGIIGATGYTGAELVRLLYKHREVEVSMLTSRSSAGEYISDIYPGLTKCVFNTFQEEDYDKVISEADIIFIALPHGHSVPIVSKAVEADKKVIDLGADFRLKDADTYEKWYGLEHKDLGALNKAVYGLPEIYREKIADAKVVANPGCYPTSVILALAPLLENTMVDTSRIVADSKSGVTGAGKKPNERTHFVECNENINPYAVDGHRHRPEIEQELGMIAGQENMRISFTPHLIPISRGILSTVYAFQNEKMDKEKLREIYTSYYAGENFIRILGEGKWPHTRWVYGSNFCDINFAFDEETGVITVLSAIDNLVKGASGQAIQNMNLMFGLPEETGLRFPGLTP